MMTMMMVVLVIAFSMMLGVVLSLRTSTSTSTSSSSYTSAAHHRFYTSATSLSLTPTIPSSSSSSSLSSSSSSSSSLPITPTIPSSLSSSASSSSSPNQEHRRRVRYSGLYPKKYAEKYKELQGDADTIEKVKNKGSTPAGLHIPIMVNECLQYLGLTEGNIKENAIAIDCTLGGGGHSAAILGHIATKNGTLYCIDQDIASLQATTAKLKESFNGSFKSFHMNFGNTMNMTRNESILGKVTCLLADLGFSSMQIDNPDRGFSYKHENSLLDMRMNTNQELTAEKYLSTISIKNLTNVLINNADFDDRMAFLLAKGIVTSNLNTTAGLASKVKEIVLLNAKSNRLPVPLKPEIDSIIARVMQSIRIEVNDEFRVLDQLLESIPSILEKDGRVVILTFHSGEDRRVKKNFKENFKKEIYKEWGRDVVLATNDERKMNPRSKCCKLRWAVRA